MDELDDEPSRADIDVLLVDVVRPDAISIEDDVRHARRFTDAPILFLTGLAPDQILDRAITAGADAVISKSATSADLICQFVDNARVRARLRPVTSIGPPVTEEPADRLPRQPRDWLSAAPTLAATDGPLAYLENGLQSLIPWTTKRTSLWSRSMTVRMLKTVRRLRRLGEREFHEATEVNGSRILDDILAEVIQECADEGVMVSADIHDEVFFTTVGSEEDAEEGLDALLNGLVCRAASGDRIKISLTVEQDQACLVVRSNRALVAGPEEFFATRTTPSSPVDGTIAELQCGAALLCLREQQILMYPGEDFRIVFLL